MQEPTRSVFEDLEFDDPLSERVPDRCKRCIEKSKNEFKPNHRKAEDCLVRKRRMLVAPRVGNCQVMFISESPNRYGFTNEGKELKLEYRDQNWSDFMKTFRARVAPNWRNRFGPERISYPVHIFEQVFNLFSYNLVLQNLQLSGENVSELFKHVYWSHGYKRSLEGLGNPGSYVVACSESFLQDEIEALRPRLIIIAGARPTRSILGYEREQDAVAFIKSMSEEKGRLPLLHEFEVIRRIGVSRAGSWAEKIHSEVAVLPNPSGASKSTLKKFYRELDIADEYEPPFYQYTKMVYGRVKELLRE